jgi:hypothetical protein
VLGCAFYQPQHLVEKCWAKTILLSKTGMFGLSAPNFNLQGHMPRAPVELLLDPQAIIEGRKDFQKIT